MSLIDSVKIRNRKDISPVSVCPDCNTNIDDYYGFCRPCFNKYTSNGGSLQGYPLIVPKPDICTLKYYQFTFVHY